MKVIATIWKQPYQHERNAAMIAEGVNAFRIKCSHHDAPTINQALLNARAQIDACEEPVQLLADLPEAKIRLGYFRGEKIAIDAGSSWQLRLAASSDNPQEFLPLDHDKLPLAVGDEMIIGEGELMFEVIGREAQSATLRALNGGVLIHRRSIAASSISDAANHITPLVREMIPLLPQSRPDLVAFSFVSSSQMMQELRALIDPLFSDAWQPQIIAKIESPGGVEQAAEILDLCDGLMVARGDLALYTPFAELGLIQKKLVRLAQAKNKMSIVATGLLGSMLTQRIPARSDILDVTNACLDGASAIMLCLETAHNEQPEEAVRVARQIITAVRSNVHNQ